MSQTSEAPPRDVFLSYRRADATAYARLLQTRLRDGLPDARLFFDLDSIEPGLPFAKVINDALNSCAVLVAVIGPDWMSSADEYGNRRLHDDDFVRLEVHTACNAR